MLASRDKHFGGISSMTEAIARLADGRFIVLSEEQPAPDGSTEALLFAGDPPRRLDL